MHPKISIIIPNFNNAEFIEDCLKSVLNQSFKDWEAFIIDDASNDNSKNIISEFIKIDERSFTGRNPPEEIIDIAKFNELNDLIPNKLRIIKIAKVKLKYKINILIVCFKISVVLNDKKFVRDFFKFSS